MREMFDDAQRMKRALDAGKKPTVERSFTEIRTAAATRESKVDNPEYKALAEHYLHLLESFDESSLENARPIYTAMVQSCMNCHAQVCPGPMVRIKQLYLE